MNNVSVFLSRAEVSAKQNLEDFLKHSSSLRNVLCADDEFGNRSWDVTKALSLKAKGNKKEILNFFTDSAIQLSENTPLGMPFLNFSQAYMRYQHAMRPTKSIGSRIAALRMVESVLAENGVDPDILNVDHQHFNRAAQRAKDRFGAENAYRVGGQIEMIADFVRDHRLVKSPATWRNFLKRPKGTDQVGPEHDRRRVEKMPSQEVLDAIPKAFRLATLPGDILVTSIVAILLAAPDRANEVLLLPTLCETNDGPYTDDAKAYGLRWWPAKGAEPMVKWIPGVMTDVVKLAISQIRTVTEQARHVAKWYETNPTRVFLPPELEPLRNQELIDMVEVAAIIFGPEVAAKKVGKTWCLNAKIETKIIDNQAYAYFSDVERVAISKLPVGFPFLNRELRLKYSDALLVVFRNQFHATRSNWACMIEGVSVDKCNERLGTGSANGKKSVFERLEIFSADGSALQVTTHQFRHYLHTIGLKGGMSEVDLAKWAGRKDINQNAAYDHTPARERTELIRTTLYSNEQPLFPIVELKYQPVNRDEFDRLKLRTAHTTPLGVCLHDYTMSPCERFRDCINCEEEECTKGDQAKMDEARRLLSESNRLLGLAEKAKAAGDYGAERWIEVHQKTRDRYAQLCALYDDPNVPDGAKLRLTPTKSPSLLDMAITERSVGNRVQISAEVEDSNLSLLRDVMKGIKI